MRPTDSGPLLRGKQPNAFPEKDTDEGGIFQWLNRTRRPRQWADLYQLAAAHYECRAGDGRWRASLLEPGSSAERETLALAARFDALAARFSKARSDINRANTERRCSP